jgi:hypothetical protein
MIVRGDLAVRTAHGVDHRLFRARQIYVPARPRAAIHTADIGDEISTDVIVDDAAAHKQAVADIASVGGNDMAGAESGTDGDFGAVGGRVGNEHEGAHHAGSEAKAAPTAARGANHAEIEAVVGIGVGHVDGDGEVGIVGGLVDEGGGGECVRRRRGCEEGCKKALVSSR